MAGPRLCQWLSLLLCSLLLLKIEGGTAPIFYVESGVAKGAVCLDGTPPAYHWDKGTGDGINNWLVHFEGGGWCNNATSCLRRRRSRLGSSTPMMKKLAFSGILNTQQRFNPDFYNWNKVKIGYCDGSSFTGDVEEVDSETKLYYRGARVWQAVLDDLLAKGMKNAKMALLSGCSAGGLSSLIHCDEFRAALPAGAKVKCLSDAGYFLDAKDISGGQTIEGYFSQVAETHGSAKHLPSSCTTRLKPELCFFPQNFADHIKTPVFLVNADIDSWQIKNILVPDGADTSGEWASCKLDVKNCSPDQIKTMQGFRAQFISAVNGLRGSSSNGLYIQSCYSHCQTEMQETWLMDGSPLLDKKAVATAVADWFYDRSPFKVIDCPYPCNPTCHNRVFEAKELSDL